MLKAILFDFDGTLADSKAAFLSSYNVLAERHHYKKLTDADFERFKGYSMKKRSNVLGIPFHKIPFLIGEFARLHQRSMASVPLMEGVREMLNALNASGYTLAILSSNDEKNIHAFLEHHHLDCFSEIMCSRQLFAKDRLIRKYLRQHRLIGSEAIYIGDEERDILASRKSGVQSVWAAWGFDGIENVRRAHPDFIAYEPAHVLRIVRLL
ncbi:HAD hydrolase-like protein [Sporolactobacillus sp. CPB3-1]|uniref:HAD hydrolase-like protein n=1 Tax=Sporolactobacillus mangiferae TaxID=2940498 RepID=A0ABT0M9L9_9BACL|nr:HAD hydrolase-like protein [Sporolactobacillus mangiferae]MCL1631571.1 HAD hydrolase-like protein [Sporolactobacillus mangiferae]